MRDEIVDAIKEIKMSDQNMRQFEPPASLYQKARDFATWAPNVTRTGYRLRFKVDIFYNLLIENTNEKEVSSLDSRTLEVVGGWQEASKALFRYALNIYLAPKRPEFKRVKVGKNSQSVCSSKEKQCR